MTRLVLEHLDGLSPFVVAETGATAVNETEAVVDVADSRDALAWRTGSGDEVVDIGLAYDDTSTELRLQWGIVAGPPGYDGYSPRPTCQ